MLEKLKLLRRNVWGLLAVLAFVAASGVSLTSADRRIAGTDFGSTILSVVRPAMPPGPHVAPVGRVRPLMPPWPAALVAAGDIVPPVLAPDTAPLPVRRDAVAAQAFLQAEAATMAEATRTALSDTGTMAASHAREQ